MSSSSEQITSEAGDNSVSTEEQAEGEACFINIGPKERQQRMRFGIFSYALGSIVALLLFSKGVNRWWRLLLLLPFMGGGSGVFQALDKT